MLSEHQAAKFSNRNAPVRNDLQPNLGKLEKMKNKSMSAVKLYNESIVSFAILPLT